VAQAKGWRTPKRCVKRVAIDGMVDMVVSCTNAVDVLGLDGRELREGGLVREDVHASRGLHAVYLALPLVRYGIPDPH